MSDNKKPSIVEVGPVATLVNATLWGLLTLYEKARQQGNPTMMTEAARAFVNVARHDTLYMYKSRAYYVDGEGRFEVFPQAVILTPPED